MSEWEEEFQREFPNDHALVREVEERGALRERERIIALLGLDLDEACEVLHNEYELAAKANGWETQERSRVAWSDVPEANKDTMRSAVQALHLYYVALIKGESE